MPNSPYREGDEQDKGQTADVENESGSNAPLVSKDDWPISDYGEGNEQDQDIVTMKPLVLFPGLIQTVVAGHQSLPL